MTVVLRIIFDSPIMTEGSLNEAKDDNDEEKSELELLRFQVCVHAVVGACGSMVVSLRGY